MNFDVEVRYRQGEAIPVADALSRVCTTKDVIESETQKESCAPEYSIHFITDISCPIDIGLVKSASGMDPTMQLSKNTIYNGWQDIESSGQRDYGTTGTLRVISFWRTITYFAPPTDEQYIQEYERKFCHTKSNKKNPT